MSDMSEDFREHWACCLTAPSHYLNQCWLLISNVPWHSHESNCTASAPTNILHSKFQNYTFEIAATSPRGQWVKIVRLIFRPTKQTSLTIKWHDINRNTLGHWHFPNLISLLNHNYKHSYFIAYLVWKSIRNTGKGCSEICKVPNVTPHKRTYRKVSNISAPL